MPVYAGIDIGTLTIRLLVARVLDGRLRELDSERRIVRLGEGLQPSRRLQPGKRNSRKRRNPARLLSSNYSGIGRGGGSLVLALAVAAAGRAAIVRARPVMTQYVKTNRAR